MRYEKRVDPFYKSTLWRRARMQALERDLFMCVECMNAAERGEMPAPRPATVVHHIIPRAERPDLELDLENLQSLCDACHNKKHPEKGQPIEQSAPMGVRIIKV